MNIYQCVSLLLLCASFFILLFVLNILCVVFTSHLLLSCNVHVYIQHPTLLWCIISIIIIINLIVEWRSRCYHQWRWHPNTNPTLECYCTSTIPLTIHCVCRTSFTTAVLLTTCYTTAPSTYSKNKGVHLTLSSMGSVVGGSR